MLFVKITLQLRLTFELHSIPLYTLFAKMTTRSNEMITINQHAIFVCINYSHLFQYLAEVPIYR